MRAPYSAVPDRRGESHPHNAGWYWVGQRRICAVCERVIGGESREDLYRAEAHAELVRIAGREFRRDAATHSDPVPGSGGSTPPRGPRPEGRGKQQVRARLPGPGNRS